MPEKKKKPMKNYKLGRTREEKVKYFQSENFIKAQAAALAALVNKHKNKSLRNMLIKEVDRSLLENGYFNKVLLEGITLQQFLQLELLCGRFLSLYEKHPRNCVTKVGTSGNGYFTAANYNLIFERTGLEKKTSKDLSAVDEREKKMKALKKSLEKAKTGDPFFKWVGETFDGLFGEREIPKEQESFDKETKPTVELLLKKAKELGLFDAEEAANKKKLPAQLIRKWGVVIFDLLMKQSVDMVGKDFSALLGELQQGYMGQRVSQFKKVLEQATSVCGKEPIQLLQEVNTEYGLKKNFYNGEPNSMSVISIPKIAPEKVTTNPKIGELCVCKDNNVMYASFHADSSGVNTLEGVEEVFTKFLEGGAQILIMGIDSNAKGEEKYEALNNLVKEHKEHKGRIFTIDNQGRDSDSVVEYDELYPTSVGVRTLLQSQLTKAGESLKFSIDRLIILCNPEHTLNVELVEGFYPRTCLTPSNPSDHVPMLFKVTIAKNREIAYDEHILVYNMAGPNTNLAEYYTSGETTIGGTFAAMELGVAHLGQGGVAVGIGVIGGARRVKKSRKKRGRRGKKSKRGSRRN